MSNIHNYYVINETEGEVYGLDDGLTEREAEALLESLIDENPYDTYMVQHD